MESYELFIEQTLFHSAALLDSVFSYQTKGTAAARAFPRWECSNLHCRMWKLISTREPQFPCFVNLHVIDTNYTLDATAAPPG